MTKYVLCTVGIASFIDSSIHHINKGPPYVCHNFRSSYNMMMPDQIS